MAEGTGSEKGWPTPGPQEVSVQDIMTNLYFMTDKEWEIARTSGEFDYVVIGSSFCALGFTKKVLENNPNAKILIIDRGAYFHPEHFQNLPPAYCKTVGGESETFHWRITEETHNGKYIHYQHGMNNFFGGRSSFWSAWCPEPTSEEMAGWPKETIEKVHQYFSPAKQLLHVIHANEIIESGSNKIFGKLQEAVYNSLEPAPSQIQEITRVDHAPLAVNAEQYRYVDYEKYSAAGPLLSLLITKQVIATKEGKSPPLKILIRCLVKKIRQVNGKATFLETDKGDFKLGDAKLILAMGTLPPTTLMLNSFPDLKLLKPIGTRFSAHFISSIIARVRPSDKIGSIFEEAKAKGKLEMAAVYVAGENLASKHQFHIQISAVIDETPIANIYDTLRHLPDVVAAPSLKQLMTSKGYVLFVCACLGQIDHNNSKNYFRLNADKDITSNATLQCVTNDTDEALWDTMDDSTFKILDDKLDLNGTIEYWHGKDWQKGHPDKHQRRVPGLVHESSTMWIGEEGSSAPVDLDYKFRGVENVYLTGGALWPTGASWNPTCAMTGMAMDLADRLSKRQVEGEGTS